GGFAWRGRRPLHAITPASLRASTRLRSDFSSLVPIRFSRMTCARYQTLVSRAPVRADGRADVTGRARERHLARSSSSVPHAGLARLAEPPVPRVDLLVQLSCAAWRRRE